MATEFTLPAIRPTKTYAGKLPLTAGVAVQLSGAVFEPGTPALIDDKKPVHRRILWVPVRQHDE